MLESRDANPSMPRISAAQASVKGRTKIGGKGQSGTSRPDPRKWQSRWRHGIHQLRVGNIKDGAFNVLCGNVCDE